MDHSHLHDFFSTHTHTHKKVLWCFGCAFFFLLIHFVFSFFFLLMVGRMTADTIVEWTIFQNRMNGLTQIKIPPSLHGKWEKSRKKFPLWIFRWSWWINEQILVFFSLQGNERRTTTPVLSWIDWICDTFIIQTTRGVSACWELRSFLARCCSVASFAQRSWQIEMRVLAVKAFKHLSRWN